MKQKTFRKETDPTYDAELHKVEKNNHDGTYEVDGKLHSRKDLQVVRGTVIPSKKPTAAQKQKDKVGKAAYDPVLKDLMGSRPTLEQVEKMLTEPKKPRGNRTERDYAAMMLKKYRTPAPASASERTKK